MTLFDVLNTHPPVDISFWKNYSIYSEISREKTKDFKYNEFENNSIKI